MSIELDVVLAEGNDIESLTLKECKAYLRIHGLRLAGNRAVCVDRIREHWRYQMTLLFIVTLEYYFGLISMNCNLK